MVIRKINIVFVENSVVFGSIASQKNVALTLSKCYICLKKVLHLLYNATLILRVTYTLKNVVVG